MGIEHFTLCQLREMTETEVFPPHILSFNSSKHAVQQHLSTAAGRAHIPAPPVPDPLAVSTLVSGQQVWMLPVNHFQVVSAAHFHFLRFVLKQHLSAQLVKHDGVHFLWQSGRVSAVRKDWEPCLSYENKCRFEKIKRTYLHYLFIEQ